MNDYRDDDRTDRGWCPICGGQLTTVMTDMSGVCPEHGRVWVEFEPPPETPRTDEKEKV